MNINIILAGVILILVMACTSKKDNIIAIDVLLTPSEEVNNQALHLNALIKQNNPSSMQLDEKHIPHITLLQCFVKESDLPEIVKSLDDLYEIIQDENLYAKSLVYDTESEESFAMIQIEYSNALSRIHEKTIERVKPYIVKEGSQESFVPNPDGSPINKFTVDYVPVFVEKYSFENFDPHISLGTAKKIFLDSLAANVFRPIRFKSNSLDIYQLGDSGTAQIQIWQSKP